MIARIPSLTRAVSAEVYAFACRQVHVINGLEKRELGLGLDSKVPMVLLES